MYTVDDLRRDLAEQTQDLGSRVTFAEVKAQAGHRRLRRLVGAVAAALVPVVAAGAVAVVQPSGSVPTPAPTAPGVTFVPTAPDPTLAPPSGPLVDTGLDVGDGERLVLFYRDLMNGVEAALSRPGSGGLRELDDGATVRPGAFGTVFEIDDRRGGIIDYGVFGRADAQIEATVNGKAVQASTARIPEVPDATVFWIRRDGVPAAPTGVVGSPGHQVVFTARGPAGSVLGTETSIQRSDGAINRTDRAVLIGDLVRTGLTAADGGELVFWFDGEPTTAMLHAGSDDGAGTVRELKNFGVFHRPPFAIGFYGGYRTVELAGGATVTVGIYVGPAATVTMTGTNAGRQGSGRWSAHPELRIFWAVGITGAPGGSATDAQGNVLGVTDFQR